VRIIHVTPHLPPDQAANALLPFQLGEWARARGDSVHFIAHPPAAGATMRPDVTWIATADPSNAPTIYRRHLTEQFEGVLGLFAGAKKRRR